jgi:hypothetical protein
MEPESEKAIETGIFSPIPTMAERGLNRTRVAIIDRIDSREQKIRGLYGDWCIRLCRIQRDYQLKCKRNEKGELLFEDVVLPLIYLKSLKNFFPELEGYIDMRKQPYEIKKTCPYCKEMFTPETSQQKFCSPGHEKLHNRKFESKK